MAIVLRVPLESYHRDEVGRRCTAAGTWDSVTRQLAHGTASAQPVSDSKTQTHGQLCQHYGRTARAAACSPGAQ
eukprot:2504980-Prymnesium_polylepis.1